jgi:hypothetical protein
MQARRRRELHTWSRSSAMRGRSARVAGSRRAPRCSARRCRPSAPPGSAAARRGGGRAREPPRPRTERGGNRRKSAGSSGAFIAADRPGSAIHARTRADFVEAAGHGLGWRHRQHPAIACVLSRRAPLQRARPAPPRTVGRSCALERAGACCRRRRALARRMPASSLPGHRVGAAETRSSLALPGKQRGRVDPCLASRPALHLGGGHEVLPERGEANTAGRRSWADAECAHRSHRRVDRRT